SLWFAYGDALLLAYRGDREAPEFEEEMERVLSALRTLVIVDDDGLEEYHWLAARYHYQSEHWLAAVSAAELATNMNPSEPRYRSLLERARQASIADDPFASDYLPDDQTRELDQPSDPLSRADLEPQPGGQSAYEDEISATPSEGTGQAAESDVHSENDE
ncbi:MAG: hypothetical protein KC561_00540, partial [Myxococcales bacterium]|nr:hypothetical protein [Myxococcales bacterium]